jgi:hypothetical protein
MTLKTPDPEERADNDNASAASSEDVNAEIQPTKLEETYHISSSSRKERLTVHMRYL